VAWWVRRSTTYLWIVSPIDLIEIVLDNLPGWVVLGLVLGIFLIPGAEPDVVHWVQRETVSEARSEFKSLIPRSVHQGDAKRHRTFPVNSR
jgi:hypothetical protein